MEQKLTNEEIAKVFAMYLGCEVMLTEEPESINEPYVLEAVNIGGAFWTDADDESGGQEFELGKLLLTPLSKITDEHAELLIKHFLKLGISNKDVWPVLVQIFDINVPCGNDLLLSQFTVKELMEMEKQLILWGYNIKLYFGIDHWANGKTALELGIAIEQSK